MLLCQMETPKNRQFHLFYLLAHRGPRRNARSVNECLLHSSQHRAYRTEKGPTVTGAGGVGTLIYYHPAQLWARRDHTCQMSEEPPDATGSPALCEQVLVGGHRALQLH